MSELANFLIENPTNQITENVIVSKRLSQFPFTIRAMSGKDFARYQKLSTRMGKKQKIEFDSGLFNELIIINHTVEPNFKDAATLQKANCATPEDFLYKSLLAGEIAELSQRISQISGFERDIDELVEDAKNS